jgi:hypothetical protein
MNYAILHNSNSERVVEVPNMDYIPILVDYALENEMELVIYISEYKVYRKFKSNVKEGESQFSETRDKDYLFNNLMFVHIPEWEDPLIWDIKSYNYINIVEKSL